MNSSDRNPLRLAALFLACTLLLPACSGLLTSEQPARLYYTLMPLDGPGPAGDTDRPALALQLTVVPGLDTDRVLALGTDARLHRYANARWPDHLPEVLGSVMKRSLYDSGRFSTVEESGRAIGDGWVLKLEVQQFYGLQGGDGTTRSVLAEMAGTVLCGGALQSIELSTSQAVSTERLSAVVAAHQQALDEATRELLRQIGQSCPATGD